MWACHRWEQQSATFVETSAKDEAKLHRAAIKGLVHEVQLLNSGQGKSPIDWRLRWCSLPQSKLMQCCREKGMRHKTKVEGHSKNACVQKPQNNSVPRPPVTLRAHWPVRFRGHLSSSTCQLDTISTRSLQKTFQTVGAVFSLSTTQLLALSPCLKKKPTMWHAPQRMIFSSQIL